MNRLQKLRFWKGLVGTYDRVRLLHYQLLAGVWWTKGRRWLQWRKLGAALEETGQSSMAARAALERYRRLDFGVQFWRYSGPLVTRVLEAARKKGVPLMDLRLLALNRAIQQVGDDIEVRREWWLPMLCWSAVLSVVLSCTLLCSLVALSPAHWADKALGIVGIVALYLFLWPGFSLFSTRAYDAVQREGANVERAAREALTARAQVVEMRPKTDS